MFKSMKPLILTLLFIAFAFICLFTNPSQEQYTTWVKEEYLTSSSTEKAGVTEVFAYLIGPSLIKECTTSQDYVFFTLYETKLGSETLKVIGILHHFFIT